MSGLQQELLISTLLAAISGAVVFFPFSPTLRLVPRIVVSFLGAALGGFAGVIAGDAFGFASHLWHLVIGSAVGLVFSISFQRMLASGPHVKASSL